jgi:hypothetical protein
MARGRYKQKKTMPQVNEYKRFVSDSTVKIIETSDENINPRLIGSDELSPEGYYKPAQSDRVAKVPLKYLFYDWIKKDGISFFVGTILLGFFTWGATSIISIDKKLESATAVYELRISKAEEQLSSLQTFAITKEILELQIQALRSDIEKNEGVKTSEIDSRISVIEKQIQYIEMKTDS